MYIKEALALLGVVVGSLLLIAMVVLTDWHLPPVEVTQNGYRGVGMEHVTHPRKEARRQHVNQAPEPVYELPGADGPKASEVYTNLKVLGDLSQERFDRLMLSITQWVSPEQGCAYCHNEENLAADDKYTKAVSLQMLKMTQNINANWDDHVKDTGVTCYTCHRGNPVPAQVWFTNPGPKQAGGMARGLNGQNLGSKNVGTTSLPFDPYTPFLKDYGMIAVNSLSALPTGSDRHIQDTEQTYGLMMHFSKSLGVNCTFCHNSRTFYDWDQSPPQRIQAHAGISMVRELNNDYLEPLTDTFPAERKGPLGDVAKINCATCHLGVNAPLYGAKMAKHFPSLKRE